MREITFEWGGETLRVSPHFALVQRIAQDLRKVSEGTETTISLAYKCVQGGLEPAFVMVPLMHFLRASLGDKAPGEQEVFEKLLSEPTQLISFRLAYVQAMLPNVDLGKGPAAPLEPGPVASPEKAPVPKTGRKKR